MLQLQPITYQEACDFIKLHHRHHLPPQGWKFGIAANCDGVVVGVITIGRPVARHYDDGWTLEVTRCATDGTKNAPSMLYGAARRAAFAMGYRRLTTNIASEDAEPIFLPTLSSENADDSYIKKINTLKNLLLATDRDEPKEW